MGIKLLCEEWFGGGA